MTTVEGTPCACRFDGNGERLQECGEHADSRARLYAAEDRCDEHVAAMVEVADVLGAADGETAMEAARRQMEWRRQGLRVLCKIHEALQGHWRIGESSADSIRRLAARVAELEAPARRSAVKAPEYRETCECWHDDTAHANDRDACMVPRCGCKAFVLKRSSLP